MLSAKKAPTRARKSIATATCLMSASLFWSSICHAELVFSDNGRALSLAIPEGYKNDQGILAVQLDGYDISQFVSVSESVIDVSLDAPVQDGQHSIQILLIGQDGSISTLVDLNAAFQNQRPVEWEANTTFSQTYLTDHKNYPDNAEKLHGNGGLDARVAQTNNDWAWEGSISTLYDTNSQNNADLNEWAIAQYRLAAEAHGEIVNTGLSLGHIQANSESLLFSSFERRGLAAHISSADNAHTLNVFAMRSDPSSRYDGGLNVPGDSDIRSVGGESSMTIVDEHLRLSVGYVDGHTDQGVSDPDLRQVFGGNAWNSALDAYAFSQKLWLHAEYAESDFDSDGVGEGEDSKTDSASQALIQWSSDASLGWFDYWRAQYRYQEVGPDFYSVGNLSLPGDLSLNQARLEGGTDTVALVFDVSQEQTNVDDQADKATQTLDRLDISISYSPYVDLESVVWQFFGAPSLSTGLIQATHSQPRSDSLEQGFDLDQRSLETRIDMTFSAEKYNWGMSVNRIDLDDKTTEIIQGTETIYEPGSDQIQDSFSITGGWMPNERFGLNLFAQWSRLTETDSNNEFDSNNFGFDGTYSIIPDTLDLLFSYNHGIENSHFANPGYLDSKFQNKYGSVKLSWYCLKARDQHPGLVSYISGTWNQQQDKVVESNNEDWAIYIGLDLIWAASGSI